jgi:hypothetical protein
MESSWLPFKAGISEVSLFLIFVWIVSIELFSFQKYQKQ